MKCAFYLCGNLLPPFVFSRIPHKPTLTSWCSTTQANTGTANTPTTKQSEITGLSNGNFLVSWVEESTSGVATQSGEDIVGQLYDSAGIAIDSAFRLNMTRTTDDQDDFEVFATNNGGFIMAYRSEETPGDDRIRIERYDASGTSVDSNHINPVSGVVEFNPQITFKLANNSSVVSTSVDEKLGSGPIDFGRAACFAVRKPSGEHF